MMNTFTNYVAVITALLLCATISSCTTPKAVEQHHHHYVQADTLAIQAQVDKHLNSWHAQMDSSWRQTINQVRSEWSSHEDEKEVTTETVTSWVDSLGRQMRQEQRTTERAISRDQQQREERLTQEFESRLQTALARQDSTWQAKFNQFQSHYEQSDSTSNKETPVPADNRPWYKRWWDNLRLILLGAVLVAVALVAIRFCRKWLPNGL